jgi:hypothetical protein
MSRRSAEIEMDTIRHVALSGDQQPGVRCWPVAAVAEWVSFETHREIKRVVLRIPVIDGHILSFDVSGGFLGEAH